MAQNLDIGDEFLGGSVVEEVPDVPAPKKPAGRKKAAYLRAVPAKEFDIRAAHQAWKEKNGIDDDYPW